DLRLPLRECARTPMQWTGQRHGGFTRAKAPFRPVIDDPIYGYEQANVEQQRRDPDSLLNWQERLIRMRKECPEISWGDFEVLRTHRASVLALRYDWRGTSLMTLHNFSGRSVKVRLTAGRRRPEPVVDIFDGRRTEPDADGA